MNIEDIYTQSQVEAIASAAAKQAVNMYLDNKIKLFQDEEMSRMKHQVEINGIQKWITGNTMQDMLNAYLSLCLQQGIVAPPIAVQAETNNTPLFGRYITNFNRIFKSKQQSLTKESRKRITDKHIIPKWGNIPLDKIKTPDIQLWFNELEEQGYSHETLLKIKNNMSPVLDAAVEDGYIIKNPIKSTRLKIGGRPTNHHKAIPPETMRLIRSCILEINDQKLRRLTTLLCYTGMRLEEILGLKWEDVDYENNWIYIQRAVVHPGRNMPEVKEPKSSASKRKIPLITHIKEGLGEASLTGFVLSNEDGLPLTYTQVRHSIKKIQDKFNLKGYSSHDFRDTCATEWREAGIPTDIIAKLLGHSKSDITENRYIKYRDEVFNGVKNIMESISGTKNGTK